MPIRYPYLNVALAAVAVFLVGCGAQSPAPVQDANAVPEEDPEAQFAANATPLGDGDASRFEVLEAPPAAPAAGTLDTGLAPNQGGYGADPLIGAPAVEGQAPPSAGSDPAAAAAAPSAAYGSTPGAGAAPGGAADALLAEANGHRAAGSTEREAASLERALQVAPDDGRVWLALSSTRLRQGRYAEAEGLAKRSLALTEGDSALQTRAWSIIGDAREGIGDAAGAAAARENAGRFSGLSG